MTRVHEMQGRASHIEWCPGMALKDAVVVAEKALRLKIANAAIQKSDVRLWNGAPVLILGALKEPGATCLWRFVTRTTDGGFLEPVRLPKGLYAWSYLDDGVNTVLAEVDGNGAWTVWGTTRHIPGRVLTTRDYVDANDEYIAKDCLQYLSAYGQQERETIAVFNRGPVDAWLRHFRKNGSGDWEEEARPAQFAHLTIQRGRYKGFQLVRRDPYGGGPHEGYAILRAPDGLYDEGPELYGTTTAAGQLSATRMKDHIRSLCRAGEESASGVVISGEYGRTKVLRQVAPEVLSAMRMWGLICVSKAEDREAVITAYDAPILSRKDRANAPKTFVNQAFCWTSVQHITPASIETEIAQAPWIYDYDRDPHSVLFFSNDPGVKGQGVYHIKKEPRGLYVSERYPADIDTAVEVAEGPYKGIVFHMASSRTSPDHRFYYARRGAAAPLKDLAEESEKVGEKVGEKAAEKAKGEVIYDMCSSFPAAMLESAPPPPKRRKLRRPEKKEAEETTMAEHVFGGADGAAQADRKGTPMTMKEVVMKDAEDAGVRIAASQLAKLVRDPLAALIARHLGPDDDGMRARVAGFLGTEIGLGIVQACLSMALQTLPPDNRGLTSRLSRELRVASMTRAGDALAEVVMGPLRAVIATYLQDMPPIPEESPRELSEGSVREPREQQAEHLVESRS